MKTIGLCMIVKNEASVILRCLESMRPIVDYVLVEDTGSTDGTQELIRDWLRRIGLPGEVFDEPWRNFAHNRSIALKRLRDNKAIDYAFVMDADDVLELAEGFDPIAFKRGLSENMYNVAIQSSSVRYFRVHICSNRQNFYYRGVLHEFLEGPTGNVASASANGLLIRYHEDGARNQDPDKYRKDAAVLVNALATEKDPFLRARYNFYLGQTYRMCNEPDKALAAYLARAEMGFWDQEIFISLYYAAQIMENKKRSVDQVVATYLRAADAVSSRAEALHGASRLCRNSGRHQEGYEIAKRGIDLIPPDNGLYVERWIYEYGLLDEFAVNAYWAGHYRDCMEASERILREGQCPEGERERIAANARFASEKIEATRIAEKQNMAVLVEPIDPQIPPVPVSRPETIVRRHGDDASHKTLPTLSSHRELPASTNIHVLGVAHTIPHKDYLVCAFTAKVLLFPEVIQPFGWHVIEYSNEGSVSQAREHVVILTRNRLRALSKRKSREEPLDDDVNNAELREEFQRVLVEEIRSRTQPGDIVCHVWGPNMEVYNLLPNCHHVELCVGYTASPGLAFRVYESSAWMHWHYGKAGQEDGHHYKWVIPSPIDTDQWTFCEESKDYAVFLGRVTERKGINTLVEIARRMPELPIHVYGPGDPSRWATEAPKNLMFKGPVFGNERVEVVRQACCMLMPTVFIEPFGNSGIEAQLCGVPLIGTSYGAFQETILDGVTGYRCHTLADWVEAIRLSRSLDRRQIATLARSKYSKEVVGKQYDWALRQLADLSGRGWYADKSRKFARALDSSPAAAPRKPRIWLYIPYFGALPNYFQLYLDSLGRNADYLSVFLITDEDLSRYQIPDNLIRVPMTFTVLKERAAQFLRDEFGVDVRPDALMQQPYKLCDFRVLYLELFRDISELHGVTEDDFIGWGDCDLIYGRFCDFLDMDEDYHVIGGFHGHLTALRNTESFRKLFRSVDNLLELLLDEKSHIVDEIPFRKPLLDFLERNQYKMFYTNRYLCDIIPECFFGLFRQDHAQRKKNFFDGYHPHKDIHHVRYDRDGRLTVVYDDRSTQQSIYCHLQKRAMSLDFDRYENGYYIYEHDFSLVPKIIGTDEEYSPSEILQLSQPMGFAVPEKLTDRDQLDPALVNYLAGPGPHCLEIGAGWTSKPGWLATDLNPPPGYPCMKLDATKSFDIPSGSFDFVYSEHMIEHVPFEGGLNMLEECNRILKPGGIIRIVTPSLGFLSRVISTDRGPLEERYREWSVKTFVPDAPKATNAFFLNNFMRAWGHIFIYDRETLELALRLSGFESIVACELNKSDHPLLCDLANITKIPPGFLDLESMVLEGTKARSLMRLPKGRNIALGKRATQSSISPWSLEASPEAEAARVVSGHFTGSYNCHTDLDSPAWWRVDLDEIQQINEVRIYNRISVHPGTLARANRLEIQVSDDDQTWKTVFRKETNTPLQGAVRKSPFVWTPEEPVHGRYLRIQLLDREYLHLEQVEIYGP